MRLILKQPLVNDRNAGCVDRGDFELHPDRATPFAAVPIPKAPEGQGVAQFLDGDHVLRADDGDALLDLLDGTMFSEVARDGLVPIPAGRPAGALNECGFGDTRSWNRDARELIVSPEPRGGEKREEQQAECERVRHRAPPGE